MTSRVARTYNERLFSGGLRSWYHLSRFKWAKGVVEGLPANQKLIELGCYDARLLDYVGGRVSKYVGIDANWAGGLDLARRRLGDQEHVALVQSDDPADFRRYADGSFTMAVALETLEHVPPPLMPRYVDELARVTHGHLLVSVPNELGPIFLGKYLAKLALYGDVQRYSLKEIAAATARRSDLVERDDHKGFDYRDVIREIQLRFDVLSIRGLPAMGLPAALSPTVAIHARSKGG